MTTRDALSETLAEPSLPPALVEQVLAKLGLKDRPTLDIAGQYRLWCDLQQHSFRQHTKAAGS